jgi:formate hydrogenlyase subunit 4
MADLLFAIIQAAVILAIAPFITGLIRTMKARLQSRRGPPLLQPYSDLAKLFRKNEVHSQDSSWVSRLAPAVCLAAMVIAALLVPVFITSSAGFVGDIIVIVYLFATVRLFTALAGMDAGSTFGGMGGSREMMVSAIIEPAVLLSVFAVALITGTTDLAGMSHELATNSTDAVRPAVFLAFAAFVIALLADNARIPVDNPSTHLELTMIHEGMVLEYSGRELAMMEMASMTKLVLFLALAWNLFLPWGIATEVSLLPVVIGIAVFAVKVVALAVAIALIESSMAKMRLFRLPNLLTGSFILAFLAIMSFYIL